MQLKFQLATSWVSIGLVKTIMWHLVNAKCIRASSAMPRLDKWHKINGQMSPDELTNDIWCKYAKCSQAAIVVER